MIDPHGGELVDLLARAEKRDELIKEAESLDSATLSARQAADLELLAVGGFSPLRGFQGSDDWRRVVDEMRLADGLPWSIPVTLATGAEAADGDRLALRDSEDRLLGVIDVEEVFERDLEREARHVYRTTDLGATWQKVETGTTTSLMSARQLADGRILFVGNVGLLAQSRDDGRTVELHWSPASRGFASLIETPAGVLLAGESGVTALDAAWLARTP